MARRHDGPVPLLALLGGAALMAALLFGQGALGLRRPYGENAALTELAPRYLPDRAGIALGAVLAAAMIGWNGFNVGLGGASLAKVTGLPGPAGALLLAGAVLAASFVPGRWNNRIAVLTTVAALALVAVCVLLLRPDAPPVTADPGGWATLADIAAIGGYVAVFALRAPDFSRGLATRRDLAICVALLVGPATLVTAAGAGVWLRTGSADVVAVLATAPGIAVYGNIFVTVGVFAPALTTTFSGALALRALWPRLPATAATAIVATLGGTLAAARFDRALLTWLTLLAATLPPLIIPMAVEGWQRRHGRPPRLVPAWTWLPAGLAATALTVAGSPAGPVAGLAIAVAATGWQVHRQRRSLRSAPPARSAP
ncbi:hypothetical protein [Catellatospora sp. NPDC049133]|uniref:hypothetical protein n=1 Tax=Catellatospora sp. NPDC049133 TaxID=3155499 RepID=UPI0033DF6751